MSDVSRDADVEGEAPVNPYSLLEAVNASSRSAHTAWLIFLGLSAYLLLAVAGVTHKDLLVASDVPLPILDVRLELTRFFLIVPAALFCLHVALLVQLVVLARKSLELDVALQMVEATDRRSHPLRLELGNFFLVQAIAGPERSRVIGVLLHGLGWLTLAAMPVLALLFIQATFLPYHHAGITWVHRGLILADVGLLVLIAVFLMRPEQSLRCALGKAFRQAPVRSVVAVLGSGAAVALTCVVVAIPKEPADDARALFGLVARNLDVRDIDLVGAKDDRPGTRTLNLRERDLRYARLDRSVLARADLTGADLEGASLVAADLSGAALGCVEDDRIETASESHAVRCARGRHTNFAKANLSGAMLSGADLAGSRLVGANLADAVLTRTNLSGANLVAAQLDKADLREAVLPGANLSTASLVGADLSKAMLTGADLTKAVMRAAVLNSAVLSGAVLRNADLEAAALFGVRLFAADLTGARVRAASLRDARVWLARIPESAGSALADFSGLDAKAPTGADGNALIRGLENLAGGANRDDVIARLRAAEQGAAADVSSASAWSGLVSASEEATAQAATVIGTLVPTGGRITGVAEQAPSPIQAGGLAVQLRLSDLRARLTRHLAEMACQPRAADGAIATGIARRALGPGFNADPGALLETFRRPECIGGRAIPAAMLERLAGAVDLAGPR